MEFDPFRLLFAITWCNFFDTIRNNFFLKYISIKFNQLGKNK